MFKIDENWWLPSSIVKDCFVIKKKEKILVPKCNQWTSVIWTFGFYKKADPSACTFNLGLKYHELRHPSKQDEMFKTVLRNLRSLLIPSQRLQQGLCSLRSFSLRAPQRKHNADSTRFFSLVSCLTFHFSFPWA